MTATFAQQDFASSDDDLAMVREQARQWSAKARPVQAFREMRDSGAMPSHDTAQTCELAELGWLGALVPVEYGGSGLGLDAAAAILIENGRTLAATPLAAHFAATAMIARTGTSDQKQRWLPGLANGTAIAAVAPPVALAARPGDGLRLLPSAAGWALQGRVSLVPEAAGADFLLLSADLEGEAATLVIDAASTGVKVSARRLLDSRDYADILFDAVPVTTEDRLGAAAALLIDHSVVLAAAELAGIAREGFERTLGHLKTREQFGQPIGHFQALQHRAVAMFEAVELVEPVIFAAARALARPGEAESGSLLASTAKTLASQAMRLVGRDMIQLHGGMGMTDEHDIGLFLKRGRALELAWGAGAYHQDRFARIKGF